MRDQALAHLTGFERRSIAVAEGVRAAAVAATLCEHDGATCFLLTRRAAKLNAHAGQWALPGGRVDPGETIVQAALRELHEEVGLELPESAVLGHLDDYETRSGYVISPVVVWAGVDPVLTPNPAEVAHAYVVPLAELDDPDCPRFITIPESDRPVVQVPLMGTFVHAPTAAILYQLREVVLHNRPTRVHDLEQPVFAWR